MSTSNWPTDPKELNRLLRECNNFIRNAKTEWEQDLKECQKDLEDATAELKRAESEYQNELKRALSENYSEAQIATLKQIHGEIIASCKKNKRRAEEDVQKAQEYLEKYPELLAQAKADKECIEAKLAIREPQVNGGIKWAINIGFWVIVIAVLLKACG